MTPHSSQRNLLAVAAGLAIALGSATSAAAAPSPSDYCSSKCTLATCNQGCYDQFIRQGTTCGQYLSNFPVPRDIDGDGVVADNCPCVANADQANCDADAYGDACDPLVGVYVADAAYTRIACYADEDILAFPPRTKAEVRLETRYVDTSACRPPRYDHVWLDKTCYHSPCINCSLPNYEPGKCCDQLIESHGVPDPHGVCVQINDHGEDSANHCLSATDTWPGL